MTPGQIIVPAIGIAWAAFAYAGCRALYELIDAITRIRITRTSR